MGIAITAIIFICGGWFLWMKVIQPQMMSKHAAVATEAQKEFEDRKDQIIEEELNDADKFGIIKTILPEDEKFVAIASYLEPKSMGKNLLSEAKTMVTNVRKVNMSHFYFILTDKSLHATAFHEGRTVSHDIFDLNEIKHVEWKKTGAYTSGLKDALSGVQSGDYEKLIFTYKGEKYEYNVERSVQGYPIFKVRKDSDGQFYRIYKAWGEENDVYDYRTKAFYLNSSLRSQLYQNFQQAIAQRFSVKLPAR